MVVDVRVYVCVPACACVLCKGSRGAVQHCRIAITPDTDSVRPDLLEQLEDTSGSRVNTEKLSRMLMEAKKMVWEMELHNCSAQSEAAEREWEKSLKRRAPPTPDSPSTVLSTGHSRLTLFLKICDKLWIEKENRVLFLNP